MPLVPASLPLWAYAAALGGGVAVARLAGGSGSGPVTPAGPATPAAGAGAKAGGQVALAGNAGDVWGSFGADGSSFYAPSQGGILNGIGIRPPSTADAMAGNGLGGSIAAGTIGLPPTPAPPPSPIAFLGPPTPAPAPTPGPAPALAPAPAAKPTSAQVSTGTGWLYQAQSIARLPIYRLTEPGAVCPMVLGLNINAGVVMNVNLRSVCGGYYWWIVGGPYSGYAIRHGDSGATISQYPIN